MPLPVFTGQDICRQAMMDAAVLGVGAPIDGSQAQDIVNKLNRIMDNLNCAERFSYAETSFIGTMTANLNPHLIGPTGTVNFVQAQRPISIDSANIVYNAGSLAVNVPLDIVFTFREYADLAVPSIGTLFPKLLYYEQDWPNGKIYLYPVPTAAYGLNIWQRTILTQLLLTDTFSLPPGYWDAITLTLAEDICPMFEQEPSQLLRDKARQARSRVEGNNLSIPRIATRDAGMQGRQNTQDFNWLSGLYTR